MISLGIGDPDTPTPQPVVDALAAATSDPGTHQYPSNRGRPELREADARFYERRFGVALDPETEIIPALGAKECVFNLNLASTRTASRWRPTLATLVYTGGPLLAGAEAVLMPLVPERGFAPDLDAIGGEVARRARLMYLNYPNNPTGAAVPEGLFERAVEFARERRPRRTTPPTRGSPSTATSRRASSRRPAPGTSASRCSRSRRAGT